MKPIVLYIVLSGCIGLAIPDPITSTVIGATTTTPVRQRRSWLTTCKPCQSILIECEQCVKSTCFECIDEISDSKCKECAQGILDQPEDTFYCDNSVPVHQQVCRISCRSRRISPFYRHGACNPQSGQCECTV